MTRACTPIATVLAVAGLILVGCSSKPPFEAAGPCTPTTQGLRPVSFAGYDEARSAFARSSEDGSFIAVLEDVSWLRFEGDDETVLAKHRGYFEQGYTTFEVTLLTKDFAQPTSEVFVLEDSRGGRLTGKPVTYNSNMKQESDRFAARFSVSFRHAITSDLAWIRLTRQADGAQLQWTFPASAREAAKETTAPVAVEEPVNLLRPLNPAPGPTRVAPPGTRVERPVNLLREPEAGPAFPSAPATASTALQGAPMPAVGEPAWSQPTHAAPAAPPAPRPVPMPPPTVRPMRGSD